MTPTATGWAQSAIYRDEFMPNYRGNPFIEALPPRLERDAAKDLMRFEPEYDPGMRLASSIDREHLASGVASLRLPNWLHSELYTRLSRLISNGYVSRNPLSPEFQAQIAARTAALAGDHVAAPAPRTNGGYALRPNLAQDSNGLTFIGTSGIGKSTAIDMVLGLWPQLVVHSEYEGKPFSRVQVNWIKLDAPDDGNVTRLAERFFEMLDDLHLQVGIATDYRRAFVKSGARLPNIPFDMARVMQQVGLGVLVLDELQDLSANRSRQFLNFIVQLVNRVKVPVVLVGGLDAYPLLSAQVRQVRRGSTEGDLVVSQSEPGTRWTEFCRTLWKHQFTTDWVEMTDDHAQALYDVSQGITEFLVIAFKNAQIRAISTGAPHVTPRIIRKISDTLNLAGPALGAVRRRSAFVVNRLSDLKIPAGVTPKPFLRADEPKATAKSRNEQSAEDAKEAVPGAKSPSADDPTEPAKEPERDGGPADGSTTGSAGEPPEAERQPDVESRPEVEAQPEVEATAGDDPTVWTPLRQAKTGTHGGVIGLVRDERTMHQIVLAGADAGLDARRSLADAGLGAGVLWCRVAGLAV